MDKLIGRYNQSHTKETIVIALIESSFKRLEIDDYLKPDSLYSFKLRPIVKF
jgi:hypothetical protein